MYEDDQKLADLCSKLSGETQAAGRWLEDNAELVGREITAHQKELRRANRIFKGCGRAAARKMCAGVFGPSQAGKSYLVSTLAGNAERKLWTDMDGTAYDFLTDINPAGGKESTGLVTRFTLTPGQAPAGFPVMIRLLTPTDVVKILTNTYFSDAKHMEEPDREAALAVLDKLQARAGGAPTGGISEDDVEDLQEYIHKYFNDKPRAQQVLGKPFWERVVPLIPRLSDDDRAELFGIIWDGIGEFTHLYREMAGLLRRMDFSAEAFCPVSALVPRASSIIDVEALAGISDGSGGDIDVRLPNGKTVSAPKTYMAALTAELVIGMREKPAEFFEHTDLLDFPGYRSREIFPNLAENVKDPKNQELCFLRGKVEYLFQRYCAERELTSLLLCIGPSVLEVKGLSSAVDDWVKSTHGETAQARAGKENALFFILSKSDLEFENKAGVTDVSDRWDIRIESSLIKSFAQHSNWPDKWTDTGAFKNIFLMRNTTIKLALFDHDASGNETALRPTEVDYVNQFEKAFLQSARVANYCGNPKDVWTSFITPNDGGISYIRRRLDPICKPELKRAQIRTSLDETAVRLVARLRPYWRTDDTEEERKQKEVLAKNLATSLLTMAQNQRFGRFMRRLMIRDESIYDLYFQVRHRMQEEASQSNGPVESTALGPRVSAGDMLSDLFGDDTPPPAPEGADDAAQAATALPVDEAEAFAGHIESAWKDQLRELAENAELGAWLGIPAKQAADLVAELGKGFARLGVRGAIAEDLRKAARYADTETEGIVRKQAALAAGTCNTYVGKLGLDPRAKNEKARTVTVFGRERTVFTPPPPVLDLPAIGEDPTPYDRTFYTDWAAALTHLILENVNFSGGMDFDPVANSKLAGIIETFSINAPAGGAQ